MGPSFFEAGVDAAKPMCFWSQRQFALWSASNEVQKPCESPCADCLPTFQLRMKKLGRCEHPETMFDFDQDAIVGYLPAC